MPPGLAQPLRALGQGLYVMAWGVQGFYGMHVKVCMFHFYFHKIRKTLR